MKKTKKNVKNVHSRTNREHNGVLIHRDYLLIRKPCGAYKCPQFIDPAIGAEILQSCEVDAMPKAAKDFTEIVENFGLEIAQHFSGKKMTSGQLSTVVKKLELG